MPGALWGEVEHRIKKYRVSKNTEVGRANNLARWKRHWQAGTRTNFAFLTRNVPAA